METLKLQNLDDYNQLLIWVSVSSSLFFEMLIYFLRLVDIYTYLLKHILHQIQ